MFMFSKKIYDIQVIDYAGIIADRGRPIQGPVRKRRLVASTGTLTGLATDSVRIGLGDRLDVITTTLKRQWFVEIVEGRKRVEYREIKPFWTQRPRKVKTPFKLVLRNGMNPPVPVLTVRIDRIVPSPKHRPRSGTYALRIGRVLKVEHWDRERSRPR